MKWKISLSCLVLLFSVLFNSENKVGAFPYVDVPESSVYYEELGYLYELGMLDWYSTAYFSPNNVAERRQVIIMIANILGLDDTQRTTIFSDIPKDHHASGLIQSAVDKGIISGFPDGTFRPYNVLTRAELAVIVDRAFGEYLPKYSNWEFKDVSKTHYAYNAIKKMAASGISLGYGDDTYKPNERLTRGHLVLFMYRTIKYLEDKGVEFENKNNKNYNDSDIKLGMSYDKVYKYVKNNIVKNSDKSMIVTNRARYNIAGETTYLFDSNGVLTYIWHEFDWYKEGNYPDKVTSLHEMYEEKVMEEFGLADFRQKMDLTNYWTYISSWDMRTYKVMLETLIEHDAKKLTVELTIFDGK